MSELVKRKLFRDIEMNLAQIESLQDGPVKYHLLQTTALNAIRLTLYMADEETEDLYRDR